MARFLRAFPAYSAEAALAMPAIRFWALYGAIARLDAADDLRALAVAAHGANPGKDGRGVQEFAADLEWVSKHGPLQTAGGMTSGALLLLPGVSEAAPGSVAALRTRAAEQVKEQERAYEEGGWPAVMAVIERQRAENLAGL